MSDVDGVFHRANAIIEESTLAALASSGSSGPAVCAVFYVCLGGGGLAFKSRRASEHMMNFATDPSAAMVIYAHSSSYSSKRGVQLRGAVRETRDVREMGEIVALYAAKFAGSGKKLGTHESLLLKTTESTFFVFEPSYYRLIDESPSANLTMINYGNYPTSVT